MINFKNWNMTHLGHVVMLSIVLLLIISMIHLFVGPLLVTLLPGVFTAAVTLTDILLFLILVRLVIK